MTRALVVLALVGGCTTERSVDVTIELPFVQLDSQIGHRYTDACIVSGAAYLDGQQLVEGFAELALTGPESFVMKIEACRSFDTAAVHQGFSGTIPRLVAGAYGLQITIRAPDGTAVAEKSATIDPAMSSFDVVLDKTDFPNWPAGM